MVRCGIIGYGLGGSVFHAPLIRAADGLDLIAIATSRREAAPPDVDVCSPEELIARPDIDLAIITSPNHTHYGLAEAALLAGKHVVVDKPFVVTPAEAKALIALAKRRELCLTVFHNRRWDSDFLTIKQLVQTGHMGEVTLFEAHWDRFRPAIKNSWKEKLEAGAGLLFDLGPHMIDQALALFGQPEAVTADIAAQRLGAKVDDYFHLTLHYGRMRVVLSSSTLVAAPRPRFAIHGTAGSFVKFGLDTQEAALKDGVSPLDQGFGDDPRSGIFTSPDGTADEVATVPGRYLSFYEGVALAIRDGAPVPVDPADARNGLEIIELARRSSLERRRLAFDT